MFARHDLIWLKPAAWDALCTAQAATLAALQRWRDADWPLIVRRREPDTPDDIICAGIAVPPDADGTKLRIPLLIPASHIAHHRAPLALHEVLPALPERWHAAFDAFAEDAAAYDMRVYGSLALQALTGQPYLRDGSDIDIQFRPSSIQQLDEGSRLLASHLANLPLDGEIAFPNGRAVAWKEWHAARENTARVLVKATGSVHLATTDSLRAALENA